MDYLLLLPWEALDAFEMYCQTLGQLQESICAYTD